MFSKIRNGAFFVALGIALSRVLGFVRERVFAHYFGNSASADAFKAALRIPNLLQNLFGEGVLSASFIPVYAKLIGKNSNEEARQVAYSILNILLILILTLTSIGYLSASWFVDVIAPGFVDEKRLLTIELTKIFFLSSGVLVFSAWCLGILNSHKKFFLSYASPVIWNIIIIITLYQYGKTYTNDVLAKYVAYGVVVGSLGQLIVQLPMVFRFIGKYRAVLNLKLDSVSQVITNFFPVLIGRGAVQISAYIDSMLASLLATGSVSALSYMQVIYLLPISLFGISVSAAELPDMSKLETNDPALKFKLFSKLQVARNRILFFVIPTSCVFIFLGQQLISIAFETGNFKSSDTTVVSYILAISTLGLIPQTLSRLYSSCFYSLGDTRTPLRCTVIRVVVSSLLSIAVVLNFKSYDGAFINGLNLLVLSSAVGAIIEYGLLKRSLLKMIEYRFDKSNYIYLVYLNAIISLLIAALWSHLNYFAIPGVLLHITTLVIYAIVYFSCSFLILGKGNVYLK